MQGLQNNLSQYKKNLLKIRIFNRKCKQVANTKTEYKKSMLLTKLEVVACVKIIQSGIFAIYMYYRNLTAGAICLITVFDSLIEKPECVLKYEILKVQYQLYVQHIRQQSTLPI